MYGIFLGRCQPFHLGHEHAIHEIYRDGLTPIVLLGTAARADERNVYSYFERSLMVRTVFPDMLTMQIDDVPTSDDEWWRGVLKALRNHSPRVFYTHTKWEDRDMGTFFASKGEKVKRYVPQLEINATDIRKSVEANKAFLDGRVYRLLKTWGAP